MQAFFAEDEHGYADVEPYNGGFRVEWCARRVDWRKPHVAWFATFREALAFALMALYGRETVQGLSDNLPPAR